MLSSTASVVVGYLAMAAFVLVGTLAATAMTIPGGIAAAKTLETHPPRSYLISNIVLSFVAAVLGGWVTARMAPNNPLAHAVVLAVLMIVLSIVSAKTQARKQPPWYPLTIAVVGVAGVMLGALICVRL